MAAAFWLYLAGVAFGVYATNGGDDGSIVWSIMFQVLAIQFMRESVGDEEE